MPKLIKLNPDLLRDSIVELRFQTHFPQEFLVGSVFKKLEDIGYNHIVPLKTPPNIFNIQVENIFSNGTVSLKFQPGRIVFNKTKNYPLWGVYFKEIEKVLNVINYESLSINRVGIRYINEFQDTNIFNNLKDSLDINFSSYKTQSTNLKTEVLDKNFRIVINVGNGFIDNERSISLLDIDVISEIQVENQSLEDLLRKIDVCHSKEKEIFENLLNKDYLESLKPEYE